MTAQEAFRLGFFACCAEKGLPPEAVSALCKRADVLSTLGGGLGQLGGLALGGLLLAPPAAGYMAGWAGAKAQEDDVTPEDFKKQELIAEYRRLAARIRHARRLRQEQEEAA